MGDVEILESVGDTDATLTVRPKTAELSPSDAAELRDFIREGTPENTIRAREGDLRRLDQVEGYPVPLPVILGWMTRAVESYAVSTVERTIRTLSRAHHTAGVPRGPRTTARPRSTWRGLLALGLLEESQVPATILSRSPSG